MRFSLPYPATGKPKKNDNSLYMEDLQVAIVNWVIFNKLNKIKLSKNCRSFIDLTDGIILFELLSRMY